ncbi:MAG: hypothetical protein IH602_09315 [Bryobacteraceae bacterium]|nr:hypothetical protein [Bryobacteraceae bacterium]
MKKLVLVAAVAGALLAGSVAAKPNFTGDWKLNAAKSSFGDFPAPSSMTLKIAHEEPGLKVATAMVSEYGDWNTEAAYTTDGKECVNKMREAESKSVLKWEADALAINTKAEFGGNPMTIDDKWSLSEDGKTLTIERKFSSDRGELIQKVVMDKQ